MSQASGERNYHVFYEMLWGLTEVELENYRLTRPEDYFYLNQVWVGGREGGGERRREWVIFFCLLYNFRGRRVNCQERMTEGTSGSLCQPWKYWGSRHINPRCSILCIASVMFSAIISPTIDGGEGEYLKDPGCNPPLGKHVLHISRCKYVLRV